MTTHTPCPTCHGRAFPLRDVNCDCEGTGYWPPKHDALEALPEPHPRPHGEALERLEAQAGPPTLFEHLRNTVGPPRDASNQWVSYTLHVSMIPSGEATPVQLTADAYEALERHVEPGARDKRTPSQRRPNARLHLIAGAPPPPADYSPSAPLLPKRPSRAALLSSVYARPVDEAVALGPDHAFTLPADTPDAQHELALDYYQRLKLWRIDCDAIRDQTEAERAADWAIDWADAVLTQLEGEGTR